LPIVLLVLIALGWRWLTPAEQFAAPASSLHPPAPPPIKSTAELPTADEFAHLVTTDAFAALDACLLRYSREVKGYRTLLIKQERVNGKLGPIEQIDAAFREEPFSVFLSWRSGWGRADRTLYVRGANDNQLMLRPTGLARAAWNAAAALGKPLSIGRDPLGAEVMEAARFPITEFGVRKGTERTIRDWKAAEAKGVLKLDYLGKRSFPEFDQRPCYVLHRRSEVPEQDNVADVTIIIDAETWLQVGSILKNPAGEVVGSYLFTKIELNPKFGADDFQTLLLAK
jgi:hypothetical protein